MKLHDEHSAQVIGDSEGVRRMTMTMNAKSVKILLDKLYTNKEGAVVRETCTNAYDSMIDAGKGDQPIRIWLPNALNPQFVVEDEGVGLGEEQVYELINGLFNSTKENSNKTAGAFGLGSKCPYAITDAFNIIATKEGVRRTFMAYKGDDGVPCVDMINSEDVDAPNGVRIEIPVGTERWSKFRTEAKAQLRFFNPKPIVDDGVAEFDWDKVDPVGEILQLPDGGGSLFAIPPISGADVGGIFVLQGPVGYFVSRHGLDSDSPAYGAVRLMEQTNSTLVVNAPMGSVDVPPSREGLEMSPRTIKVIDDACVLFHETLRIRLQDLVNVAYSDASKSETQCATDLMKSLPSDLERLLHEDRIKRDWDAQTGQRVVFKRAYDGIHLEAGLPSTLYGLWVEQSADIPFGVSVGEQVWVDSHKLAMDDKNQRAGAPFATQYEVKERELQKMLLLDEDNSMSEAAREALLSGYEKMGYKLNRDVLGVDGDFSQVGAKYIQKTLHYKTYSLVKRFGYNSHSIYSSLQKANMDARDDDYVIDNITIKPQDSISPVPSITRIWAPSVDVRYGMDKGYAHQTKQMQAGMHIIIDGVKDLLRHRYGAALRQVHAAGLDPKEVFFWTDYSGGADCAEALTAELTNRFGQHDYLILKMSDLKPLKRQTVRETIAADKRPLSGVTTNRRICPTLADLVRYKSQGIQIILCRVGQFSEHMKSAGLHPGHWSDMFGMHELSKNDGWANALTASGGGKFRFMRLMISNNASKKTLDSLNAVGAVWVQDWIRMFLRMDEACGVDMAHAIDFLKMHAAFNLFVTRWSNRCNLSDWQVSNAILRRAVRSTHPHILEHLNAQVLSGEINSSKHEMMIGLFNSIISEGGRDKFPLAYKLGRQFDILERSIPDLTVKCTPAQWLRVMMVTSKHFNDKESARLSDMLEPALKAFEEEQQNSVNQ